MGWKVGWMGWMVAAILAGTVAPAAEDAVSASPRFKVQGSEILGPDGNPVRLRGFNVLWWVPATAQDAVQIRKLKANCVRYMFGYQPGGTFDKTKLACVEQQLPAFSESGLWVIPTVHMFQRKSDGKWPWEDEDLQREFLEMWTYLIERFRDDSRIVAWEPLNEPHSDGLDGPTLHAWYEKVIAHIRKLDPDRPIVVEGRSYSWAWALEDDLKLSDPNIIYSFHMYAPFEFTHQKKEEPARYPGKKWTRETLVDAMSAAVRFRQKHNVPIYCGEWGAVTGAPGCDKWLLDVASILEEQGFHWTHWAWAHIPSKPVNDSFDVNTEKKAIYEVLMKVLEEATLPEPVIRSKPWTKLFPDQPYRYRLVVNGTPLPAIEVTGLPKWSTFDGAAIAGTPTKDDIGETDEIVVRGTNAAGQQEQRFRLRVLDAVTGNGTGLRGEYFATTDLKDLKVSRVDSQVDFSWPDLAPDPAIDRKLFTARWTGEVQAQLTDEYTFYTRSDDGARLWVNGKLLVDEWHDQASTEHSGRIWLDAGKKYRIRMEYLQTGGGSEARLLWSSTETPKQVIPASQLYAGEE